MPKTNFRPDVDGFEFDNNWNLDSLQINLIQQILDSVSPAVATMVGPLLAPAFISAALATVGPLDFLGSLIGIAPGAIEGLEPIALGLAVGYVKENLNGWIADALSSDVGLCGGMSFAPLDYYNHNWLIQRGVESGRFKVPQSASTESLILRDYIFQRHLNSWQLGGVAVKTLEWMAVLFLVPEPLGGGASELFKRTKGEFQTLQAHLDSGDPWPVALIFDSKNPADQHQVVAYGYTFDNVGNPVIYAFDGNQPNHEITITIRSASQDFVLNDATDPDYLKNANHPHPLRGIFCSNYFAVAPPPAVGIDESLTIDPDCGRIGDPNIHMTFRASNVGFKPSTPVALRVSDSAGEHFGDNPDNPVAIDFENHRQLVVDQIFQTAGLRLLKAECVLKSQIPNEDGTTLYITKTLPPLADGVATVAALRIFPLLRIHVVSRGDYGCMADAVEGKSITLNVTNLGSYGGGTIFGDQIPISQLQFEWSASAGTPAAIDQPQFVINSLPPAGTTVAVKVKVSDNDGCFAVGSFSFVTLAQEVSDLRYRACVLIHKLQEEEQRSPSTLPQGPGDPADLIAKLPVQSIQQISNAAARLTTLAHELKSLHGQLNRHTTPR